MRPRSASPRPLSTASDAPLAAGARLLKGLRADGRPDDPGRAPRGARQAAAGRPRGRRAGAVQRAARPRWRRLPARRQARAWRASRRRRGASPSSWSTPPRASRRRARTTSWSHGLRTWCSTAPRVAAQAVGADEAVVWLHRGRPAMAAALRRGDRRAVRGRPARPGLPAGRGAEPLRLRPGHRRRRAPGRPRRDADDHRRPDGPARARRPADAGVQRRDARPPRPGAPARPGLVPRRRGARRARHHARHRRRRGPLARRGRGGGRCDRARPADRRRRRRRRAGQRPAGRWLRGLLAAVRRRSAGPTRAPGSRRSVPIPGWAWSSCSRPGPARSSRRPGWPAGSPTSASGSAARASTVCPRWPTAARSLAYGGPDAAPAPDQLRRWAGMVEGRGACHHPDGVVRLVRSLLLGFPDDVARHAGGTPCQAAAAGDRAARTGDGGWR